MNQLYLALISIYLLIACNAGDQSNQPLDDEDQSAYLEASKPVKQLAIDTVVAPHAPYHITRTITEDKHGNLWLGTFEGVIKYDGESFINITNKVDSSRFFAVLEDSNGHFWLSTIGNGVYYYDQVSFKHLSTQDGLINNRVTCILEDKKGDIWFGTEGGLSRYSNGIFQNFTVNNGLTDNAVETIAEDKKGRLWLGTRNGVSIYDGGFFHEFLNAQNQSFGNVRSITEDQQGAIWIGEENGFWKYNNGQFTKISHRFTGYIYEDKSGNIWTAEAHPQTNGWSIYKYPPATLTVPTGEKVVSLDIPIFGITKDQHGNIWFGTLNGIYKYDGESVRYFYKEQ